MVDEESQDVKSEPAGGAPVNRDQRRDPDVIEGEVAGRSDDAPPDPAPAEEPSPPPPAPPLQPSAPGRAGAFVSGALGGLIVSALAAGAGWYFLAPNADLAGADANRLAALETQVQKNGAAVEAQASEGAAVASLDKRVAALEGPAADVASIDKRVGALESADAALAPKLAAVQAVQDVPAEMKSLRADVDAARGEIPALSDRLAKLELAAPQAGAASAEIAALSGRLDKVEAKLAAPKTETRVAPEKPTANDNPGAVAIVSGALSDKLAAGAPFPAELAALEKLGVDPAKLAALKAVANGAPSGPALAASFHRVAGKVLAATTTAPAQGGVVDRFLNHMRGLVQVRDLNETPGDDPSALVSQIETESRRGDVGAALAAYAKLPAPARAAAADWAAEAGARQAANAAIQSIRDAAIERLTASAKP